MNWANALAYELEKHLSKTLNNFLHLPYVYNIRNPIRLITDLRNVEIDENMRICSFDIINMYTNEPN
jgi:hypothetical protein